MCRPKIPTIRGWHWSPSGWLQWSPQCRQWPSWIHNSLWSASIDGSADRHIQRPLRRRHPRWAGYYEFFHVGQWAASHAEALATAGGRGSRSYGGGVCISAGLLGAPRTTRDKFFDLQYRRNRLTNTANTTQQWVRSESNIRSIQWIQPSEIRSDSNQHKMLLFYLSGQVMFFSFSFN